MNTTEISSKSGTATRLVLTTLGVAADLIAFYTLFATDAKAVVAISVVCALTLSTYTIWLRWKADRRQVPLLGIAIGMAGAALGASVLAYEVGESEAESRLIGLEREKEELSAELRDAREQSPDREHGASSASTSTTELATTTTDPDVGSTSSTSTEPSEPRQYLADSEIATGEDYTLEPGEWTIEGTLYSNSLGHDIGCASSDRAGSEFNVDREYQQFHAVVGLSDNAGSNETATFILEVDGTQRLEQEVGLGESMEVTEDIAGAFRISLYVSTGSSCFDNREAFAVWGDAAILR